MSKHTKDQNLNITINNSQDKEEEVVLSVVTIFQKIRKYFGVWLISAIVIGMLAVGYAVLTTHVKKAKLTALVSFSYSGIEKGKDPSGRKFDINTIKNPAVIEKALDNLGMDLLELENIRQGISFKDIIPQDAIDRITAYKSVYETANSGNLAAAQAMLDTTYFPTQFQVYFDYNNTEFTTSEAVDVFNEVLNQYQNWFYEEYGYNESIGAAVTAINYEDYDYAQSLDVLDDSLSKLRKYVKTLANEDTTRFRSAVTGYTFDDLAQSISTVRDVNFDQISSIISVNNVTKDKDQALNYYEYRIKALERQQAQYEEQLASVMESIDHYEKDQVMIINNSDVNIDQTITQASEQYDRMFRSKLTLTDDVAETKQRINYYKDRMEALQKHTNSSEADKIKVEEQLAALSDKVNELIESVSLTAEDYYKNVTFKNAYNVLVPASNTATDRIGRIVSNAKLPLVALEGLALMFFFAVAVVEAIKQDSAKRKAELAVADAEEDDEDEDTDDEDMTEEETAEAEEAPEKKDSKKKK
ncbi:MAG: lipopolysaccharide biosynthesis protein [Ruminococcus sp.]|nr:lipopolysaccharide biosynthesis protein [Ruminococcus sp.]